MDKIKVKLLDSFEETGLCSWISFNALKDILEGIEKGFNKDKELSTEITGFIITDGGIQIQKEYKPLRGLNKS